MMELLLVITPIALIDSTSVTPLAIVPLTLTLAGRRAYVNAVAFLLGLYLSYFGMAVAFLFGLSAIFGPLNRWLDAKLKSPDPADLILQIVIGLVLIFFGLRIALKRQEKTAAREAVPPITPASAFSFAAMLNIVGFPGAVPYFAAADQILKADLPAIGMVLAAAYYVALFVLPLSMLVVLRAILGSRGDAIMRRIKEFFDSWGRRVLIIVLVGLGVVLVVDGIAFLMGHPVLPVPE
jgi:threonine/homoserine/homoserine lactone efflux protein